MAEDGLALLVHDITGDDLNGKATLRVAFLLPCSGRFHLKRPTRLVELRQVSWQD